MQQLMPIRRGRGRPPRNYVPGTYPVPYTPKVEKSLIKAEDQVKSGEPAQPITFTCTVCSKSYETSPALYLHMKMKHQELQQVGKEEQNADQNEDDEFKQFKKRGRPREYQSGVYVHQGFRMDPIGQKFITSDDKAGGPLDPYSTFADAIHQLFPDINPAQHLLHEYMIQFAASFTPLGDGTTQVKKESDVAAPFIGPVSFKEMQQELNYLSENKRNLMSCDQIFSIYLRDCSQYVNKQYYSEIVEFLLMYHDALNQFGWQRRAQYEVRESYGFPDYDKKLQEKQDFFKNQAKGKAYTSVNNAEFAPEIANDFILEYVSDPQKNKSQIERQNLINLCQHFCHWMFVNHLTCSKIALMPDNPLQ